MLNQHNIETSKIKAGDKVKVLLTVIDPAHVDYMQMREISSQVNVSFISDHIPVWKIGSTCHVSHTSTILFEVISTCDDHAWLRKVGSRNDYWTVPITELIAT